MAAVSVRAQAKINLFLRVTGREASGYHTIETLFSRIALADVVSVRLTPATRSLDCDGPALPRRGLGTVAENLAWRAAVTYADAARWPGGFAIELEKHIPVSAGLGGGSADAGAVLRALNGLNPRPLARETLQEMARALGADVPFLTQDESSLAIAAGRGDAWHGIRPLPECDCILVLTPIAIGTADAYAWIDAARGWTGREVAPSNAARVIPEVQSWNDARQLAHNDFEAVVFPRHPEIAAAWSYLTGLVAGGDPAGFARLSGSGSAVFAVTVNPLPSTVGLTPPPGVRTTVTRIASRVESVQPLD